MKPKPSMFVVATSLAVMTLVQPGSAATVTKGDNTSLLDLGASWGGTAPGASDIATWLGTYNTTSSLSAAFTASTPVSWQGIKIGAISGTAAGLVSIGGTGNAVTGSQITLGTGGIDMSSANQSLVINAANTVLTGASQTWTVASGLNLRLGTSGTGSGNAKLSGTAGTVVTIAGSGVVDANQGGGTGYADSGSFAGFNGKWVINNGATLRGLRNGSTAWGTNAAADAITLNGGTLAVGGINGSQGNWTWNTNMTLADGTGSFIDDQIYSGSSRWLKLEGAISGGTLNTGTLTFKNTNSGQMNSDEYGYIIAGTNTFTGGLTINTGTFVRIGGSAAGTANEYAGNNGSLASTLLITDNGVLRLTRLDSWTLANNISGSGQLKIGGGLAGKTDTTTTQVVTVSGTNTYTGATSIINGTLNLTGSLSSSSAVSLASGATLKGTGTAAGTVTVATGTAAITAGDGTTGQLTLGNLTFSGTGKINVGSLAKYTGSAAVNVTGNVTLNGAAGAVTLSLPTGVPSNGTYHLISHANTLTDLSGFTVTGPTIGVRQSGILTNNTGMIDYVVAGDTPYWTGALGSEWSTNTLSSPKNWKLITAGTTTDYIAGDAVLFNDNATSTTVDISVAAVAPTSTTFTNATLNYTIQGSYGITSGYLSKSGAGSLTINTANSYGGGTTLTAGTIILGSSTALGSGSVALNGGTLNLNGQSITNAITASGGNIAGSGTLGGNVTGGTLSYSTSGGTLVLTGTDTSAASIGAGATLQVGAGGTAGSIDNVTDGGALVFNRSDSTSYAGVIGGTGSLQKLGAGTLTLTASNSYGGVTSIDVGTLKFTGSGAIDSTSGIAIASGAVFEWGRDANVTRNLSGAGTVTRSTTSGNAVFSGSNGSFTGAWNVTSGYVGFVDDSTVGASSVGMTLNGGGFYFTTTGHTLAATRTITLGASGGWLNGSTGNTNTIAAKITGSGGLYKVSGEKDILTAVNDFTGNINITGGGTLEIGGAGQLGNGTYGGTVAVASGNTFSINTTASQTLGGVISGAGNLTKNNSGSLTLSAANTYTGTTTVSGGTLKVTGSTAAGSAVTVSNTGTRLTGTGTIGGNTTINAGAILAPGTGVGTTSFGGNLTCASGSIFEWELAADPSGTTRGSAYDAVNVAGTVGGTGAIFRVVLNGAQNFGDTFWDTAHSWTDIITAADGTTPATGWTSIFAGVQYYNSANGDLGTPSGQGYFTLSGNTLTWTAVPEPTSALAGLLLAAGFLRRKRP